jgi:mannose-6-phosphate isomerase
LIQPYPLLFEPILLEKVWGGRRLERLGKTLPAGKLIGESWELADLDNTSVSGAGGGAARSVIANGPLAGSTLRDAMNRWKRDLLADHAPSRTGGFPLLVKLLDARENLSVQVHPSPEYALSHEDAHLKTECWYVVDAQPVSGEPALIYKGLEPGVTRERLKEHARSGAIVDDLLAAPARKGDCHNLPSGTVHALGAGVLVAEIQTPSDTTFRLFDWDRSGRELHVEEAVECAALGAAPEAVSLGSGRLSGRVARTDSFDIQESVLPAGGVLTLGATAEPGPRILIVLSGSLSIRVAKEPPVAVGLGQTVLIPAAIVPIAAPMARPGTRVLIVSLR